MVSALALGPRLARYAGLWAHHARDRMRALGMWPTASATRPGPAPHGSAMIRHLAIAAGCFTFSAIAITLIAKHVLGMGYAHGPSMLLGGTIVAIGGWLAEMIDP